MKLTARARYAVTALADIAAQQDGVPVTLAGIATRNHISQAFLEQLFKMLRESGLVTSIRGARGGYVLAHPADEVVIADIVRAIDEPVKTTACTPGLEGGCTGGAARCLTHDLWDELGQHIAGFLGTITLTDIVEQTIPARRRALPPIYRAQGNRAQGNRAQGNPAADNQAPDEGVPDKRTAGKRRVG